MDSFASFLETKHHNERSMTCGHCTYLLRHTNVTRNPKHIYEIGTMFKCLCGKSAVWTNSIRGSEEEFIANLDKCNYRHTRGFCNDAFCGHCFGYVQPLKNGERFEGKYVDRYGCEKCKQNQHIMVDLYDKDKEGEATTNKLLAFYQKNANAVRQV
jgi:hypothetical protein